MGNKGDSVSVGLKRAMNLALGHFIAKRLGAAEPVRAAELTAIRSAVEDQFEEATAGITAVDVQGGWTADEAMEQYGMRVAVDMIVATIKPTSEVPPTAPTSTPEQGYRVVCDDNFDPEAERLFVAKCRTAADAIRCAQEIVDGFLADEYKAGMTADELYDQYTSFGEDPWIKSPKGMPRVEFSAWDYARKRSNEICARTIE